MYRVANLTMLTPFDKNWKFRVLHQKEENQRMLISVKRINY